MNEPCLSAPAVRRPHPKPRLDTHRNLASRTLIEVAPAPRRVLTLFQEPWWVEVASNGRSEQVEVAWDGKVVASLSYVAGKQRGLRYIGMPDYTQTLGPVFDLPPSKTAKRAQNKRRLIQELTDKLPPHDHFLQVLDPADDGAFGFSLAGFKIGQRFTFRSSVGQDLSKLWTVADQKLRNIIRTAEDRFKVIETTDIDYFSKMSKQEHAGETNYHDFPLLEKIFAACLQRNCATVLVAMQEDGTPAAAATLIWGKDAVYYWLSARDRSISGGGANALLLWSSIKLARRLGLTLDFDGYRSILAAKFLEGFGEQPVARIEVRQTSWRYDAMEAGKRPIREALGWPSPA
jgi:hypothetical protein